MLTKITVIGINHKKAPVEIREKFSLSSTEQTLLLSELKNHPEVLEAFVLSTCNRVEIYAHLLNPHSKPDFIMQLVCKIKGGVAAPTYLDHFYSLSGEPAVRHLFNVTAGLDSLVLGEKQILGQVKEAILQAQALSMFQHHFNILTNLAIRAGKKAQHETDISRGGSSVGWAAVELADQLLSSLQAKSALIIGAGKISQLTLQQIHSKKIQKLFLMNRTHEKAVHLTEQFPAEIVSLYDMRDILKQVDVCITSVSAPHSIIEQELLQKLMPERAERPLLIIDLGVPRNVDPLVASVPHVTLKTVDDLAIIIQKTMAKRQAAIEAVEKIIDDKIADYHIKIQKINDRENIKGTAAC